MRTPPPLRDLAGTMAALLLLGCGGGPEPLPPATHADFRAIQREEAVLATAHTTIREADQECPTTCGAAEAAGRAAERLCEVARQVADADARARCARARTSERESVAIAKERCPCP